MYIYKERNVSHIDYMYSMFEEMFDVAPKIVIYFHYNCVVIDFIIEIDIYSYIWKWFLKAHSLTVICLFIFLMIMLVL